MDAPAEFIPGHWYPIALFDLMVSKPGTNDVVFMTAPASDAEPGKLVLRRNQPKATIVSFSVLVTHGAAQQCAVLASLKFPTDDQLKSWGHDSAPSVILRALARAWFNADLLQQNVGQHKAAVLRPAIMQAMADLARAPSSKD
jgi:hypothetical protein